jgi:hypothetical protein
MPASDSMSGWEDWVRESLGIPDKFWDTLATDDDWTFVIKVHGLIEASLNQLLLNELNKPELETFISRIETADERTGKLAVVRACNLLNKNVCTFVRALSVLRNKLVHNIKNLDLKITEYAGGLTGDIGRDWRNGLKSGLFDLKEIDGTPVDDFIKQDPRTAITIACLGLMHDAFQHHKARPSLAQSNPKK